MCLAIPSQVVAINGEMATVECFGRQRTVSLMLMNEPVDIGDYVAVQSGSFAVERLDAASVAEALAFFEGALKDEALSSGGE